MTHDAIKEFAKENGIKLKRGRKPGQKNKPKEPTHTVVYSVNLEGITREMDRQLKEEIKWNKKVRIAHIFLALSFILFTILTIRAYNQVQEYNANQEWQIPQKGE